MLLAQVGIRSGQRTMTIEQAASPIIDEIVISFVMILNEQRILEEAFMNKTHQAFDMTDSKFLAWT